MNVQAIKSLALTAALLTTMISVDAFADCKDVGSATWNSYQTSMGLAFDEGNLDEALSYAKQLIVICDKNPVVNTVVSDIYEKQGKSEDSCKYIRRASDTAHEYNLPMPLLEKIWFKRAECELPYKAKAEQLEKELEVQKNALEEKSLECAAQEEAFLAQIEEETMSNQATISSFKADVAAKKHDSLYKAQWMSAGSAFVGVAAGIAGGVLLGLYYPEANDEYSKLKLGEKNHFQRANQFVQAGAGVLGAGLGLGVVGSILAIYFHFKMTHIDFEEEAQGVAFGVDVVPNYVGFSMTF